MRKTIIIAALILGIGSAFAQRKTIEKSSIKVGSISAKHSITFTIGQSDTLEYLYLGFQNAKYQSITDIKSYMFSTKGQVEEFRNDLTTVLPEMEANSTVSWNRSSHVLMLSDSSDKLYLFETRGSGYTTLTYKQVSELLEWVNTVEFN